MTYLVFPLFLKGKKEHTSIKCVISCYLLGHATAHFFGTMLQALRSRGQSCLGHWTSQLT
jgi:hypothetical protein